MDSDKTEIIDIPDKYFYFPIIVMISVLVIKFVIFTRIYASKFLLGDLYVHLPSLFFLKQYGFHGIVANWYQGTYILLQSYPPGWFFFTYPIYNVLNDVFLATFVSLALTYLLGFIFIYFFGGILKISKIKRIAFFTLFYANSLTLNTVFDTARIPDIFSWTLLIPLLALVYFYIDKKFDAKFYFLLTLIYSILILSHIWVSILSSILILGLIIKRRLKEWIGTTFSLFVALVLTFFWWIPFVVSMLVGHNQEFFPAKDQFLILNSIFSFNTFIILALGMIFYFYWKSEDKSSKERWFFIPILIMGLMVIFRIIVLIPLFNRIPANSYNYFFLFILIILFLRTKFSVYPKIVKKSIPWLFIMLAIGSTYVTFFHFSNIQMNYSKTEVDLINILQSIPNYSYLIVGDFVRGSPEFLDYTQFSKVISYATIYYNLTTPSGSYWHASPVLYVKLRDLNNLLKVQDCNAFNKGVKELNVDVIISHDEFCNILNKCGFKEKLRNSGACIMKPLWLS